MRCRALLTILATFSFASAFADSPQIVVLDVQNMTCRMCPITVKKSLERVPGVSQANIDFDKKTATVAFDPARTSTDTLIKATTNAGYPARVHR
jgi:mercuric ion binding protein